jgi:phage tail sheath protein FI
MVLFDVKTNSPGVYVFEETSSAPIAGVGTSTAGFIGIIPNGVKVADGNGSAKVGSSKAAASLIGEKLAEEITVNFPETTIKPGSISSLDAKRIKQTNTLQSIVVEKVVKPNQLSSSDLNGLIGKTLNEELTLPDPANPQNIISLTAGDQIPESFRDKLQDALGNRETLKVQETIDPTQQDEKSLVSQVLISEVKVSSELKYAKDAIIDVTFADLLVSVTSVQGEALSSKQAKLCTNFSEFKKYFGDFSLYEEHNRLAHAVYGFFKNGGTRCFVIAIQSKNDIGIALNQLEAIDEIAIVAAPGITDSSVLSEIDTHCRQTTQDRVAIFDGPETSDDHSSNFSPGKTLNLSASETLKLPAKSDYAALYYPWLQVYDPASQKTIHVPPSGHIAGIYARVDSQRGVFKAPANEPIFGALGVTDKISKRLQAGLNSQGVNCIRELNGSTLVWGARTWGGDVNGDFTYISTRRLFNYIRESIDEGTQWVVFEPNSPDLWARIRREVTAFLTMVWRSGALFGNTPEEAFFVKCDTETNPPEDRKLGKVTAEIGVSVVTPAEFVIFSLSQQIGSGGS